MFESNAMTGVTFRFGDGRVSISWVGASRHAGGGGGGGGTRRDMIQIKPSDCCAGSVKSQAQLTIIPLLSLQ